MSDVLNGVRAKIDRAEQHLDELKLALKAWVTSTGNAAKFRSSEEQPDRKLNRPGFVRGLVT